MGVEREDVVTALESIQEPVSLFEPVYHDDGDAIYVRTRFPTAKIQTPDG